MSSATESAVSVEVAKPRGIAAVRARVPTKTISQVFGEYLNQVYAAARAGTIRVDGQNIFVYRKVDDPKGVVDVEFGVGVFATFQNRFHRQVD